MRWRGVLALLLLGSWLLLLLLGGMWWLTLQRNQLQQAMDVSVRQQAADISQQLDLLRQDGAGLLADIRAMHIAGATAGAGHYLARLRQQHPLLLRVAWLAADPLRPQSLRLRVATPALPQAGAALGQGLAEASLRLRQGQAVALPWVRGDERAQLLLLPGSGQDYLAAWLSLPALLNQLSDGRQHWQLQPLAQRVPVVEHRAISQLTAWAVVSSGPLQWRLTLQRRLLWADYASLRLLALLLFQGLSGWLLWHGWRQSYCPRPRPVV